MKHPTDIPEAIALWPSRKALAADVGAPEGVVHKWARHGRIPADRMADFVRAARVRGFEGITAEWLVEAHKRQAEPTGAQAG